MQKDLFGGSAIETAPIQKIGFLERRRFSFRLDQVIVAFILLLIVYVLVFSFGVETGKRYAMAELKAERAKREIMIQELSRKVFLKAQHEEAELDRRDPQAAIVPPGQLPSLENFNPFPRPSSPEALPSVSRLPVSVNAEKWIPKGPANKYTIQVITFTSSASAENALKKFAEKGLKAFLIPAGKFWQVCVDSFESRQKALDSLRHLKMRGIAPPDAYVRLAA